VYQSNCEEEAIICGRRRPATQCTELPPETAIGALRAGAGAEVGGAIAPLAEPPAPELPAPAELTGLPEADGAVVEGVLVGVEPAVAPDDAGFALAALDPPAPAEEELDLPGNSCATTPTIMATEVTAAAVVQRNALRTRANATSRWSSMLARCTFCGATTMSPPSRSIVAPRT